MPQAQVQQIERIQNKRLWRTYNTEFENIRDDKNNGQDPDVKFLYHGTKNTEPSMIYNGEEGFDMKFGVGGMWGQAVYFAVNSSYSHGYSSILQNG